MAHNRFRVTIIMAVFLFIIAFPLINGKLKLMEDVSSAENRALAKRPAFNLNNTEDFPGKFEKYFNDAFPLRSLLVDKYNSLVFHAFKRSPVPEKVIIGKEGWLFTAGDEENQFFNKNPMPHDELEAFRKELNYRTNYLAERGCKLYFVIVPNKASIYPEYVIGSNDPGRKLSTGEELLAYLEKDKGIRTVNAYSSLRSRKGKELLYYKTDNHWTQVGAFTVANAILDRIHQDIPAVEPLDIRQFLVRKSPSPGGNLANMMSGTGPMEDVLYDVSPKSAYFSKEAAEKGYAVPSYFAYTKDYEVVRAIEGSDKPRLLLISDSFGATIFPYLSERFSHSVKIFDAWEYKLNADIVKSEKPDVMVIMVHEARIGRLMEFAKHE